MPGRVPLPIKPAAGSSSLFKEQPVESVDNNPMHVKSDTDKNGTSGMPSLTLKQKKENHIMSENRRRALIRASFDDLVKQVPQLDESESRSEYSILVKTTNYIEHLRNENERLEKLKSERNL